MKVFIFLLLLFFTCMQASPLQDAIDKASPYATLHLKNGHYLGNITINKPLRLIGDGDSVVIDGQGRGNVISIG